MHAPVFSFLRENFFKLFKLFSLHRREEIELRNTCAKISSSKIDGVLKGRVTMNLVIKQVHRITQIR